MKKKHEFEEEAFERLIVENGRYRKSLDDLLVSVRHYASHLDGMSLKEIFRTLVSEKDEKQKTIEKTKEEMKKVLSLLCEGKTQEAKLLLNNLLYQK